MAVRRVVAGGENQELICLYGDGGVGKTRLLASLCRSDPQKYGRALYLATDPGSKSLSSVLPQDHEFLEPIIFEGEDGKWDPYADIESLLKGKSPGLSHEDWAKLGIKTILWDSVTTSGYDILTGITNSSKFTDKHVTIQRGLNFPVPGDYGSAQYAVRMLFKMALGTGCHLLCVHHAAIWEPDQGDPSGIYGGPMTVGKGSIRETARQYHTVLRVETKSVSAPGRPSETTYQVRTSPHGVWVAKYRTSETVSPIPIIPLTPDPVNFWHAYNEAGKGKK
jgi:hypothetical protein